MVRNKLRGGAQIGVKTAVAPLRLQVSGFVILFKLSSSGSDISSVTGVRHDSFSLLGSHLKPPARMVSTYHARYRNALAMTSVEIPIHSLSGFLSVGNGNNNS
ncbi:hypothetical protein KC19_6G064900 [Ceratodon purpureus]|uniref:Uncharacterized protein n=1 Tax=Ceratodon purpureus TaxID=3225 RepID=A0A8T0HFP1_CERPU|nr:hypothetical protein KC19_6G064900 [Ceratodon purpureus]